METIVPIASAIIGVLGGFIISYFNNKKNEKMDKSKLALEIVKLELERATKEGLNSSHSTLAHWAVVSELIKKYNLDLNDPSIKNKIQSLTSEYREYCFSREEEDLAIILEDKTKENKETNEFLLTIKGLMAKEILSLSQQVKDT